MSPKINACVTKNIDFLPPKTIIIFVPSIYSKNCPQKRFIICPQNLGRVSQKFVSEITRFWIFGPQNHSRSCRPNCVRVHSVAGADSKFPRELSCGGGEWRLGGGRRMSIPACTKSRTRCRGGMKREHRFWWQVAMSASVTMNPPSCHNDRVHAPRMRASLTRVHDIAMMSRGPVRRRVE